MKVYLNGKFLDEKVALPIANELSFLRGFAIFDFFPIRGGTPLFINDYLDRFYQSAHQIGLDVPMERHQLLSDIKTLVSKNGIRKAYFKMILTGGNSPDGFRLGDPNLYIFPKEMVEHPQSSYSEGVKLLLDDFKRELPTVKTTNYLNAIMKIPAMDKAGAVELLYHDNGYIRECSRCNFFMVKEEKLITPESEILKGITRKQILNVAKESYAIEERDVQLEEIESAEEVFISSTTKLLFPVVQIDSIKIGNGSPGPVTLDLLAKMKAHTAGYIMEHV